MQPIELKVQRVGMIKFDGTIESYNEIVEKCFPCPEYFIIFIDENYNQTNMFTGKFLVDPTGIMYQKDNYVQYEIHELQETEK